MSEISPQPFAKLNFCSLCGADMSDCPDPWPEKKCRACNMSHYHPVNSVAVLVIYVERQGLVTIERGINPVGGRAFPGGFQAFGETWQEAAAREVTEEAQIVVNPKRIRLHSVVTNPTGHNLLFGVTYVLASAVQPFVRSTEVRQRSISPNVGFELCFPSHTHVLRDVVRQFGVYGNRGICP